MKHNSQQAELISFATEWGRYFDANGYYQQHIFIHIMNSFKKIKLRKIFKWKEIWKDRKNKFLESICTFKHIFVIE